MEDAPHGCPERLVGFSLGDPVRFGWQRVIDAPAAVLRDQGAGALGHGRYRKQRVDAQRHGNHGTIAHIETVVDARSGGAGKDLTLVWADLPGWYSHFSAFGNFEVAMEYARGTTVADIHRPLGNPSELRFQARGTVEHLSSREPFAYDWLWLPLRYIGRAFPSLKPIIYHHEVIIAPGLEGGFVHARAFGADFRNGGGLFDGSHYHAVQRVRVNYGTPEPVDNCGGSGKPTPVYRSWDVHASTSEGELLYIATRTHPPAMAASNTNQYHFTFHGNWRGEPVTGHGYGEYIRL